MRTYLCLLKKAQLFCGLVLVSCQAMAELTEFQVLQLGMENSELRIRWQAQLDEAQGKIQHSGRWENPSIEYSQEELDLPDGSSQENTLWLSQKINIAGVKGLERKAAEKNYLAQEKQQSMDKRAWRSLLRGEFYLTLAEQQKRDRLKQVRSRLETIHAYVKQRAERGDASKFDALRIQKELSVIESQYVQAEANFVALLNQLSSKIDTQVTALRGSLMPQTSDDNYQTSGVDWSQHPHLLALENQIESADLSAKAASRERWPEVTLGIGRKEVDEPGLSSDGNTVSIGITLPIFDNARGEKRVAESVIQQLRVDKIMLLRKLNADYQSALYALHANQKASAELAALNSDSKQSLSGLAEASYQAGELSVMELLDAYQSDLETDTQTILTALEARRAYIQLQYLRGE